MEHRQVVPYCAGRDQTVDTGSNREACAPRGPVELRRFEDHLGPEGRFHDRKREHRVPRERKSPFFPESLKHFLDDRKTRHDVI